MHAANGKGADETTRLYGRDRLVDRVARSRATVTLVPGDSGIGKSSVLAAVQERRGDAVAPPPRTFSSGGGVLQNALLLALGDAVAQLVTEEGDARRAAALLTEAAKRLARDRGQELAQVIGKEILTFVRGRVGPEAGNAIGDYLKELKTAVDDQLGVRISAATDPGVAGLILEFAGEICDLAGEREVLLALDRGERLRNEDLRVLVDLSETMPERLRLRIALATYTASERQKARLLEREGREVAVIEVPPLDEEAVAEWLCDRDLSPERAPQVVRASGGYALHVGDLIDHLERGGEIEDAPLNEQFARRTRDAWEQLDSKSAEAARALSVFTDPLPSDRVEGYLKLSPHERGELENRLSAARIFSVDVDGQRWFHEQRRQFIRDEILDDAERAAANANAMREIWDLIREEDVDRVVELAALVEGAPELLEDDERLAAVVALDESELAVAAAMVEMVDPDANYLAVGGDELLTYARAVFGGRGDLIPAVRGLEARGLIVLEEEESVAAVVPYGWKPLMFATLAGRAERDLGRRPIPRFVSAIFELEIHPRLGDFEEAAYGVGRFSMRALGKEATQLSRPRGDAIVIGGEADPGLLLRVSYAGRPMFAVATFSSAAGRDAAQAALSGLETELVEEALRVTDAMPYPVDPIPSQRFVQALRRAVPALRGHNPQLRLDQPLSQQEVIERRARLLQTVRSLCSPLEMQAMQIEEPVAFASYEPGEEAIVEVEIRGGREGVLPLATQPDLPWGSPYAGFTLAEEIELEPSERIGVQRIHLGTPKTIDPVVEEIASLAKRGAEFNSVQGKRRKVILEEASLTEELSAAARQQLDDARVLSELPLEADPNAVVPAVTYVVLIRRDDEPLWQTVVWAAVEDSEGEESVELRIVSLSDLEEGVDPLQAVFGIEGKNYARGGKGVAETILADMLGHDYEDLELIWPEASTGEGQDLAAEPSD